MVVALRSEGMARGEALRAMEADKAKLAADGAALRDQIAAKRGEADKCAGGQGAGLGTHLPKSINLRRSGVRLLLSAAKQTSAPGSGLGRHA